jgi:thiol-disulfide isomerase/thioredoxin
MMMHGRTVMFAVVMLVLVAAGAYAVSQIQNGPNDVDEVPKVSLAPQFKIADIDGRSLDLAEYPGRVVVLDLFATWCGPCRTQMGELNRLRAHYTESEVIIISIDIDPKETTKQVRDFKNEFNADWFFARDTDGVGQKYDARNIPTMAIIGPDGELSWKHAGVTTFDDMVSRIDPLLA